METNKKKRAGFTLVELLIVVAIVGVLVAISIPIFSAQMYKAKVAVDEANVRAYFSQLQSDYIVTGTYDPRYEVSKNDNYYDTITYSDGTQVKLQTGIYMVRVAGEFKNDTTAEDGYQIAYMSYDGKYTMVLGASE